MTTLRERGRLQVSRRLDGSVAALCCLPRAAASNCTVHGGASRVGVRSRQPSRSEQTPSMPQTHRAESQIFSPAYKGSGTAKGRDHTVSRRISFDISNSDSAGVCARCRCSAPHLMQTLVTSCETSTSIRLEWTRSGTPALPSQFSFSYNKIERITVSDQCLLQALFDCNR